MPNFIRIVSDAYEEILERAPDAGGLAHFNDRMNQGLSEADLREALLRSDEYAQKNPPPGSMALRVDGNRFVDPRGNEVKPLGAIVCCDDAKTSGWPLVTLDVLDLFASHGLSYTHCRLGPFTLAGEDDPIYVGYVTVADGRVDLEQFFPAFWQRARGIADRARQLRIYVEFDLIDRWVRQHGETDLPQFDPWSARNNIQGVEAGGRSWSTSMSPCRRRRCSGRCAGPGASAPTSCTGGATTARASGRARSRSWSPSPPATCVDLGPGRA